MPDDVDTYKRDFYRELVDGSNLQSGDQRYVDLTGANDIDLCERLRKDIAWASSDTTFQLVSGFRGAGKTTQLLRLRDKLRAEGYAVLYVNVEDYIEVNVPLDAPAFLITLVAGIEAAATGTSGDAFDPQNGTSLISRSDKEPWWDRVKRTLGTEVAITELGVNVAGINVAAELKDNADFRRRVREASDKGVLAFRADAHDFVSELAEEIREHDAQCEGVVVIADSLDHADNRASFAELSQSIAELFSAHISLMRLPDVHVIYTVPPYLKMLQTGAADVRMQTTLKVTERNGEKAPGHDLLKRIIARRAPDGDWERLLSTDSLDKIITQSGGHLRDAFRLVAEVAATAGQLPADEQVVERAIDAIRNSFLPLADDEREWLREVSETKTCALPTADSWATLAALFDRHLILGYLNGAEWYDVHPLVLPIIGKSDVGADS